MLNRTLIPAMLVLIVLIGCSPSSEDQTASESSLSSVSSSASSSDEYAYAMVPAHSESRDEVFAMVKAATPDLKWNDEFMYIKYDGEIMVDSDLRYAPANTVKGYLYTVPKLGLSESRDELTKVFTENGWKVNGALDADGVFGSVWGYSRREGNATRILMMSQRSLGCTSPDGTPDFVCQRYESAVLYTELIPDDILMKWEPVN